MQRATAIKNILKDVVAKISGDNSDKISRLQEAWPKALENKKAQDHTSLASFKAKKLVVNVDSSAWMYELNMDKKKIKEKLNQILNKQVVVDEIILRIGEIN